jgi:AraC-like DNA-binding protein
MKVEFIGYSYAYLKSVAMHQHPYWEIVIFLEGSGIHTVGDKTYNFKENTIICQPPNVKHGTVAHDKYRDMYIVVKDFIPPFKDESPAFIDDEENRFRTLANLIHLSFHRKEANYDQIAQAMFQAMYQMLIGWSQQKPGNNCVDSAVNELIANFSNPDYSAASLNEKNNYTSDHFRRRFKAQTGTTPTAYLINLRIEHAKKLLAQKNKMNFSIKEVAHLCGFSDPYYFSRLFKEKTGSSPSGFKLI